MKVSNIGAGKKSCEGENDKTGNLKYCNLAEPNRRFGVILALRVLILIEWFHWVLDFDAIVGKSLIERKKENSPFIFVSELDLGFKSNE